MYPTYRSWLSAMEKLEGLVGSELTLIRCIDVE